MKFNMDSSSVVSEPISTHHRNFSKQKSASMMTLNAKQNSIKYQPLPIIDPKQSNIESAVNSRHRRKNTSFGGILSQKSHNSDARELRSALQDREAVIQNLRVQLCLGKLPRPSGPPFSESDIPAAEQKISRLKIEVENKKIAIRNLKSALDKLDITDNIDIRIRQAELEYALGREELQLLSIVEELRALQARLDKSRPEANTLYSSLVSGSNLALIAVQASSRGGWGFHSKSESPGWYVEWASENVGLCKDDRIIEINGRILSTKSREDIQNILALSSKCQVVVVRNKMNATSKKQLMQQMEDNLRLQHRISYLEEQVKDLQNSKENVNQSSSNSSTNSHVTSINISSPPSTPPDKPLVYQRGNFITTLIGGKPIEIIGENSNVTKTLIHDSNDQNGNHSDTDHSFLNSKSSSTSKISINSRKSDYSRNVQSRKNEELNNSHSIHARSVEQLNNYCNSRRSDNYKRVPSDARSIKSLDFENDFKKNNYSTEPRIRPTPPKKPLRLSLQRAQSLQTVEINDLDQKKRSLKRTHFAERIPETRLIENYTASLGRQKEYMKNI